MDFQTTTLFSTQVTAGGALAATSTLSVTTTSTLTGDATFGGHIVADADEAKNIFAAVTTAGNAITLGGGGKVVAPGALSVATTSTLTGDVTFGGDILTAAGAKAVFADAGANTITIGGSSSTASVFR